MNATWEGWALGGLSREVAAVIGGGEVESVGKGLAFTWCSYALLDW
jgi:hypothetical protein